MYNCTNSESDYFLMKHVFFYLALNKVIEVIAFIEGLDQVSKPIREYEKCAITVVTKISTCNQRYESTLQMAFELQ